MLGKGFSLDVIKFFDEFCCLGGWIPCVYGLAEAERGKQSTAADSAVDSATVGTRYRDFESINHPFAEVIVIRQDVCLPQIDKVPGTNYQCCAFMHGGASLGPAHSGVWRPASGVLLNTSQKIWFCAAVFISI
ncbi:MAG: hypothetical protein P8011_01250, partial [Acidihalobacter sp.]